MSAQGVMSGLLRERIAGLLLGTAVGDALGLPREGLTARRATRLFGPPPLRHAFLLGRGMCSDDTEHTCLVAQAWLAARGDVARFPRALAWRLRWWLLGLPAGVGFATLRACLRLWLGYSPERSGVFSAGNGPAMRSAVLAACTLGEPAALEAAVRASTRVTHADPRAEQGALAVALVAQAALQQGRALDPGAVLGRAYAAVAGSELKARLVAVQRLVANGDEADTFRATLGIGERVSGYVNQTVPAALFCWGRWHGDFRATVEAAIGLGGDTDTVAAIAGALAGATVGAAGIPQPWVAGLLEWPRSARWLGRVAEALTNVAEPMQAGAAAPVPLFWQALLPRNALFLTAVLLHGLRRLLPPY